MSADPEKEHAAQELVIRALDRANEFKESQREILWALVRQHGLFPYLNPDSLHFQDLVAYEAHRPIGYDDEKVVFHRVQAQVYRRILAGKSVVLSAPTSFGKSLVIDALIATRKFQHVAVVVPTIALIDETRRRLARFREYKLITHPSQPLTNRTIMVLTQERLLEVQRLPPVGLFVIDEFYKLALGNDPERAVLLNQALHRLYKTGAQFYLAGPSVQSLAAGLPPEFDVSFIATNYSTVAIDIIKLDHARQRGEVVRVCNEIDGSTLVYCATPNRVRQVGRTIIESRGDFQSSEYAKKLSEWVGNEYHSEWLLAKALQSGIGLHHGRLPRALGQEIVRAFNSGELDTLICTSTLIEGVNTRAKNVVIYDNKVAQREYDFFTFNNIKGRSGRMWRHFIGRVFIFHDPPSADLPVVDIPVLSQAANVPESLLIQLDPEELTSSSWQKVKPYYEQSLLSIETLRANSGVDLEQQLGLAERLEDDQNLARSLAWTTAYPRYEQLVAVCELIVDHMPPNNWKRHGAVSAKQLAYLLQRASIAHGSIGALIDDMLASGPTKGKPDESVEAALDFMRYWPGHHLPRRFQAVQLVAHDVCGRKGWRTGNYSAYISRAHNLFMDPFFSDLEEYGLPAVLTRKLRRYLSRYDGLDDLLAQVRSLNGWLGLSFVEQRLLRQAQEGL